MGCVDRHIERRDALPERQAARVVEINTPGVAVDERALEPELFHRALQSVGDKLAKAGAPANLIDDRAAVRAERGAANSGSGSSSASTRARQVSSAYLYQVSSPRPMT